MRRLRRMEHASSRKAPPTARPQMPGPRAAQGPRCSRSSRSPATTHDAPRLASGHRRVRPRHRRRLRARLGAAARRRSRHRQIDAADPGRGRAGPRRPARGLYLRRGGGGAGAAARRAARPRRRAGRARRRDLGRGHRRDARRRRDTAPRHHRFDPDHVDRHGRIRARHRHAGARERAGADPLRQALGRGRHPGRPRHQGRPDRRARAWSSTWSTRCCRSKARARTSSASCARSRTASARPTRSACSR